MLLIISSLSCNNLKKRKEIVIGFSQCFSNDEWRKAMNDEINTEVLLHNDFEIKLIKKDADGNTRKQQQQVQELLSEGINILLISPNEAAALTPTISEVYRKGIPVVVMDRNIANQDFTAFVGGNNFEVGQTLGRRFNAEFPEKYPKKILEVTGMGGSSPAVERERGFLTAVEKRNLTIKKIDGRWHYTVAFAKLDSLYKVPGTSFNFIFAHNDEMALAARKIATRYRQHPIIYGVDGLQTPNGGISMVYHKLLDATVSYPTGGDKAVDIALKILNHEKVPKYNYLNTFPITAQNVSEIYNESRAIDESRRKIRTLSNFYTVASSSLRSRNIYLAVVSALCILLIITLWFLRKAFRKLKKNHHEIRLNQKVIDRQYGRLETQRNTLLQSLRQIEILKERQDEFLKKKVDHFTDAITLISTDIAELPDEAVLKRLRSNLGRILQELHNLLNLQNSGFSEFEKESNAFSEKPGDNFSNIILEESKPKNTKVLIVEDNAALLERMEKMLMPFYKVITAKDGQAGYELAKYHGPDLIVSDILMPETDGFELCRLLASNPKTHGIPVILLSSIEEKSLMVRAYDIGADAIVTKPFEKEILLSRINNLLAKRSKLDSSAKTEHIPSLGAEDEKFVNDAREIIIKNIDNSELSVDDVAEKMAMSRSKFYRKIKIITGYPPNNFIKDCRLEFAGRLLLKRDLSISEVAYMSGFIDVKYFTKCFNEKYGMTPTLFKKSYK